MTPDQLARSLREALRAAVDEGELQVTVPEQVGVKPPGPGGSGDWASNLALQVAGPAGEAPLRVAGILRERFLARAEVPDSVRVDISGPGFLNFRLGAASGQADLVREILERGAEYGHQRQPAGTAESAARPKPPLTLLHPAEPRAAVLADTVRRMLDSQGTVARTVCAGPIDPAWERLLGVRTEEGTGQPRPALVPVPAAPAVLALGRDAGRWALLHPAPHDRVDASDSWLVQRETNPLFRVRYAHSRVRALLRNATDLGFGAEPGPLHGPAAATPTYGTEVSPAPDVSPAPEISPAVEASPAPEAPLLHHLAAHPTLLTFAATGYAPDRLCRHLVATADAFLRFHDAIPVLPRGPEKPSAAHRARLALAAAAGTVLAGGLNLLGIDAPEHL